MLEYADAHSKNDSLPDEGTAHDRRADDQSLQNGAVWQRAELPEGGHLARFGVHTFSPGEYVSIKDEDGELHTFVVASVEAVEK
jgi:hypothetical protein